MEQLGAQDASFVYMETAATPMHVGSLQIYDGSEVDPQRLTEEAILKSIGDRLDLNNTTRRRMVRVPFEADYPYWIEDANFDLEYHVRRVALPNPKDRDALQKLACRIFARPLDMTKPLWEVYVIEGLDNVEGVPSGSFAMLSKTHHAAVDGASGLHFLELLHDLTPAPTKIPPATQNWRPDPFPSDAELMFRSSMNHLTQPFRMFEAARRHFKQAAAQNGFGDIAKQFGGNMKTLGGNLTNANSAIPKTRFNGAVTPHRVLGSVVTSLDEIRTIRVLAEGATVNDVVLAVCGGALRRYLDSKNELDPTSLVAMAPVNVRGKGETASGGNQVSALFVRIGTHIADPVERLQHVLAETSSSKLIHSAIGAANMTDYSQFVPAYTAALASRLMAQTAADAPTPPFNVSITNVPGPQQPLYFCGAPMITAIGMGPITQGMGIIFPVLSYCGRVTISFTSCREILPDAAFFEDCIKKSLAELLEAAENQND